MRNPLLNSTVDGEEGGVGTFDLEGLTCSSCVNTVRNSLAGFSNVRVALFPTPHLKVDLLEESGAQQVVDLVESMGFGCLLRSYQPNHSEQQLGNGQWKQVTLRFPQAAPEVAPFGMRILKRLPGFVVELEYDTRVFPGKRSALAEFAEYGSVVLMEEPEGAQAKFLEQKRQKELGMWKVRTLVALACALPVMVLSMMELGQDWLVFALSTVVMFYSGWPFHYEAVTTRRFNMSLLVSLGSSCAYFFSLGVFAWDLMAEHELELEDAFETSAVLIAFVVLGKYLECSAKHKTSEAVAHLATLQPSHAILVDKTTGEESEIECTMLEPGDVCRVPLGSRVPGDGVVLQGFFTVDESMLSGESLPVEKVLGSSVWSGTIPSQPFVMRITQTGGNTAVARIVQIVENAQATKAPIERMADEISARFVPFILFISVVTLVVWTGLIQTKVVGNYEPGVPDAMLPFLFALAVLVVACPCALGLATPTAVMVGCGVGAQLGVLIKSGTALEMFAKVNCIVFDKTGTLTRGVLAVEQVVVLAEAGMDQDQVVLVAAIAERNSDHPIAKALVRHAPNCDQFFAAATNVVETSGMGICCELADGRSVKVGSPRFFENAPLEDVLALESKGCTTVVVEVDGKIVGLIGLRDEAKEDAACSVAALQALGCEVFMLTGDNFATAHIVASEVGIAPSHVMAGVLPGEKAETVLQLKKLASSRVVAFVGDGINDAPALSVADVGVAIGAGTQIAIEAADMVLMNSKLVDVVTALDLSRVVFRRIQLNFLFALAYNTLGIVVACGLFYPMDHVVLPAWVAAGAMALSSVSVVSSSLALRWYKAPQLLPSFGHGHSTDSVRVDAIEVVLASGERILRKHIDATCNLLRGGSCECSPCHCKTCEVHCKA